MSTSAQVMKMKSVRFLSLSLSSQVLGPRLLLANTRHITYLEGNQGDPNDPKYAKWKQKLHPETPIKYHADRLSLEPVKGKIFDKLPFRILLEKGKTYNFCTCGFSKNQPFCDSSHKAPYFISTRVHHVKYRPMQFQVDETKEYWLCMCKQSNNRPFCDGTHKREDIQATR